MPCLSPLTAYKTSQRTKNGKQHLSFNSGDRFVYRDLPPVSLPCGQCVGCRLERSRQWAIRCQHEASLYKQNCFLTLTFNNEHLPADGSLDVRVFQKFMKRLRFEYGEGIRFYHCGEYGEKYRRPHYHAIIFNFDFPDKKFWKENNGNPLFRSASLERLWPFGYASIGAVTFQSSAYVARYIMKKINGDAADAHYTRVDPNTGEVTKLKPEYTTMSRRPGIGRGWFEKFQTDVFPHDFVVSNNTKMRPPKYYDNLFEVDDPEAFEKIKSNRVKNSKKYVDNNTPERLQVRKVVQEARLKRLVRNVE